MKKSNLSCEVGKESVTIGIGTVNEVRNLKTISENGY